MSLDAGVAHFCCITDPSMSNMCNAFRVAFLFITLFLLSYLGCTSYSTFSVVCLQNMLTWSQTFLSESTMILVSFRISFLTYGPCLLSSLFSTPQLCPVMLRVMCLHWVKTACIMCIYSLFHVFMLSCFCFQVFFFI